MKMVFYLMLLLATMLVFLPSCSKDDDEPEDIKSRPYIDSKICIMTQPQSLLIR